MQSRITQLIQFDCGNGARSVCSATFFTSFYLLYSKPQSTFLAPPSYQAARAPPVSACPGPSPLAHRPQQARLYTHRVRKRRDTPTRQYVPEVEDAQRTRSASARASPESWNCSNPVMYVHVLRPCLALVATEIGRSAPFLVNGSSPPTAMRYQGCMRPHSALSASSRLANSGTGTAPLPPLLLAFGEP
jgi:hypothetical protein